MDNIATGIKWFFAAATAGLAAALGGWDKWLMALVFCTCLDFAMGIIIAFFVKKNASSSVMWLGGLKKIMIYTVVGVAVMLDGILMPDGGALLRTLAIGYYIATEGLSVLEHVASTGVPLPPKLLEVLQQLKSKNSESTVGELLSKIKDGGMDK